MIENNDKWWKDAPIVAAENNLTSNDEWWKDAPIVNADSNSDDHSNYNFKDLVTPPKITGQITRGLLGGLGDTVNLFPMATGAIDKGIAYGLPEGNLKNAFNKAGDENLSYDIGGKVQNWFDTITDGKYKPQSTADNVIDTASSFLSPAGIAGKISKGASVLNKTGKAIIPAVGAATVLETTKGQHFLPDELPARELIEDVTKSIIGSASPTMVGKSLGKLKNTVLNTITKGDFNEQVLKYAKKEGVDLPYHVATNNDTAKFLANNMFKSYFISSSWKDLIKNADKQIINKVRSNVNNVSENIITKEQASKTFRDETTNIFKELKEKANVLYKPAIEAGKKENIMVSTQLSPLRTAISEIKTKFDPSKISLDTGGKFVYQKAVDIEETLLKQKNITIEDLYNQRSALLKDSNYGKAEGSKSWLEGLTSAIDDNIELIANSSKNNDFKKLYKEANAFYKNEYIARVKSTMGKALVKEEMPKEAYGYMNNVPAIKQLEKIIGVTPKTKPIIDDLKRTKLQEILIDKAFGSDGSLSHANLTNLFDKKSTQQGLLKELLGKSNYNSMQRLSTLSSRFIKTGKEYANPSGTSHSTRDSLVAHGITGVLGFGVGFKTAATTLVSPYILSKVMSNKKITDRLVDISIKANKGQDIKRDYHLLESAIIGLNNDTQ